MDPWSQTQSPFIQSPSRSDLLLESAYSYANPTYGPTIPKEGLLQLLRVANITNEQINEIFRTVISDEYAILKDHLMTCMQLVALAQQNREISMDEISRATAEGNDLIPVLKIEENDKYDAVAINNDELNFPTPNPMDKNTYFEASEIRVKMMPEKSGLVFKYVTYELESSSLKSAVMRRYSDFDSLQQLLIKKYPFRIIPAMPPKKITGVPKAEYDRRRV
ncbi:hypothetical protein ROZALSC1DRAFT_22403 [Rozella allomycis CSF55]|uniref:Sorting nexin MVP1 n=1 Tax=Rozella allomycis (strain CSF55) TaxID=988480 RepID=A0A4V1IZU8_ROZAC|nr:hypothetical protein ROZALSC1DRAFT_22403 [Rozella allomycis CSF55]